MENEAAIIKKREDSGMQITMKAGEVTTENIYHTIVSILEWSEQVNKIDAQKVLDCLKIYATPKEHYYNPVI